MRQENGSYLDSLGRCVGCGGGSGEGQGTIRGGGWRARDNSIRQECRRWGRSGPAGPRGLSACAICNGSRSGLRPEIIRWGMINRRLEVLAEPCVWQGAKKVDSSSACLARDAQQPNTSRGCVPFLEGLGTHDRWIAIWRGVSGGTLSYRPSANAGSTNSEAMRVECHKLRVGCARIWGKFEIAAHCRGIGPASARAFIASEVHKVCGGAIAPAPARASDTHRRLDSNSTNRASLHACAKSCAVGRS